MNVLLSILAAIGALFAPAAADIPDHDISVQTPAGGVSTELGGPDLRMTFVVDHVGIEAPALLTFEGGEVRWTHVVTLKPGRNVLIEDAFPRGDYTLTLQNVVTAASNHVELGPCGEATTLVTMKTTVKLDHFSVGAGHDSCVPAEA